MAQRLVSLDAVRGFTMLWLAVGAGSVRSFQKLFDAPWLIDVKGWSGWTMPLVVIGTNALAAYKIFLRP